MGLVVGIDASRNRSGGAKHHLVGVLTNGDPRAHDVSRVHVWSYDDLLDALPNAEWLVKHSPAALRKSLAHQAWWQRRHLPGEARAAGCQILLNTDAGTVCPFRPAVTMSRDMLSYEPGEMQRYGLSRAWVRLFLLRHVQARSLKRADGAVFLTHYAARVIQRFTGALPHTSIIPHGVGQEFRGGARAGRRWPGMGEPIRCLYVSNTDLYKHQWKVVEAIGQLRERGHNVHLVLAGGGAGPAQRLLVEELKRTDPAGAFVQSIGHVPHAKLPPLLAGADLFVFASSCENMPNTLVEAMATGLPIACSNRGPMPEVLSDGGVYFDPEDAESIATAVERLLIDDEARAALARRAEALSRQYSWERCAAETWKFLRSTFSATSNQSIPHA